MLGCWAFKRFMFIFDEVFSHAIDVHKRSFFHELTSTDILCRVVDGWGHSTDRFIPWPSKTSNRWNPPGIQFLYLSFGEKEEAFSNDLTLNEYVCLEELRAEKNSQYSFCHFRPITKGKILDLSYNDISMSQIKSIVDTYYNDSVQKIIDEMLSEKDAVQKYQDKRKLKKAVAKKVNSSIIDKSILEESFAKQYIKMICSCIYKKVDETDEAMREKAYESFHILSQYLESKGVTGIIYPCTRTNRIKGKNLVLFNVKDAVPLPETIRLFLFQNGGEKMSYIPPEVVAKIREMDLLTYLQNENLLSLADVYQPKKLLEESRVPAALTRFLEDYPHIRSITLHMAATSDLATVLELLGSNPELIAQALQTVQLANKP